MKKTLLMTLFAFLSSQSVWPMEQTTSPELRLLAAVQQSDDALIKQLLTEGIDINAHIAESNDTTALHMAAFIGNAKIVKLLLDSNADANSIMLHEYTPLLLATENGHSDAVELLLRAGANSEYGDTEITPLWMAAQDGHTKIVQTLLQYKANVHAQHATNNRKALHQAAQNGHDAIIALLIQARAHVDAIEEDRQTALWCAMQNKHTSAVELLLKAGASANHTRNNNQHPLHYATTDNNLEMVNLLIAHGAHIEGKMQPSSLTALHLAALDNHTQIIQCLLEAHANANITNSRGYTPLWIAAGQGHMAAADLLLKAGAKIDLYLEPGNVPLHNAADADQETMVKFLLCNKANANLQTAYGVTALMMAAHGGNTKVVLHLLDAHSDQSLQDADGNTALIGAAIKVNQDPILCLLTHIPPIEHASIRNYFIIWLIKNRLSQLNEAFECLQSSGENSIERPLPQLPAELWNMIALRIIRSLAQDQIPRITQLLAITNNTGQTAVDSANANGHHELAPLLDLNNPTSKDRLLNQMEANIWQIMISKPENKQTTQGNRK